MSWRNQWISVDGTYFAGGRSTIDDALNNDLQQNWRDHYDGLGVAWQHRWGAGL